MWVCELHLTFSILCWRLHIITFHSIVIICNAVKIYCRLFSTQWAIEKLYQRTHDNSHRSVTFVLLSSFLLQAIYSISSRPLCEQREMLLAYAGLYCVCFDIKNDLGRHVKYISNNNKGHLWRWKNVLRHKSEYIVYDKSARQHPFTA